MLQRPVEYLDHNQHTHTHTHTHTHRYLDDVTKMRMHAVGEKELMGWERDRIARHTFSKVLSEFSLVN